MLASVSKYPVANGIAFKCIDRLFCGEEKLRRYRVATARGAANFFIHNTGSERTELHSIFSRTI